MATIEINDPIDGRYREIILKIEREFDPLVEVSMLREALKGAAQRFAEKWLEENKDKVIERLNIDALANMVLMEAAKQTKNDILGRKK